MKRKGSGKRPQDGMLSRNPSPSETCPVSEHHFGRWQVTEHRPSGSFPRRWTISQVWGIRLRPKRIISAQAPPATAMPKHALSCSICSRITSGAISLQGLFITSSLCAGSSPRPRAMASLNLKNARSALSHSRLGCGGATRENLRVGSQPFCKIL